MLQDTSSRTAGLEHEVNHLRKLPFRINALTDGLCAKHGLDVILSVNVHLIRAEQMVHVAILVGNRLHGPFFRQNVSARHREIDAHVHCQTAV